MFAGVGLADELLNAMGYEGHIPAEPGDYIGPEGRLHCGKCRECKEYQLKNGRYVPSLCRCGRMRRDMEEREQDIARGMKYINEVSAHNLMYSAKLRAATFEASGQREDGQAAFEAARRYVRDFEAICGDDSDLKGLLLYGPVGTGKTHLAACVGNALMAHGVPVLCVSVARLGALGFDEQREVINHMGGAKLLILDDLGAERNTDFKREQMFDIIDRRVNAMLPLIATTNLTPEDLRKGEYLDYRRIWERVCSMCRPVRMDGESWRKQRTAEAMRRFMGMG